MATGKRYYWMKLKESFMTSDTIDYFMAQPDGANYVVLYQMLCLKTINTNGRLSRQIGEMIIPYDIPKIQRDLKYFTADTIRVALELYKSFGLIYEDQDGVLVLTDHDKLVGSETDWAAQKRRQSVEKPSRQSLPTGAESGVENFHTDIEIEIRDRDKEIEIDTRDRDIDLNNTSNTSYSGSESYSGRATTPQSDVVLTIPLVDKTEFEVTNDDVALWQDAYPAVDVIGELKRMRVWCFDNPAKRKTRRGVRSFISRWLSREQDRGGTRFNRSPARGTMDDLKDLHELFREDES